MTKYGTVTNNILTLAPRAIVVNGAMVANPKDKHFAVVNAERERQGKPPYLEFIDEPPATTEGFSAVPTEWKQVNGKWVRQYEVREVPPPPPRVFSKLKVVDALRQANVWDAVKQNIIDNGLYDLYLAAQEFAEDNAYFTQGKTALQTALGWTDAQVEEVLQEATV